MVIALLVGLVIILVSTALAWEVGKLTAGTGLLMRMRDAR